MNKILGLYLIVGLVSIVACARGLRSADADGGTGGGSGSGAGQGSGAGSGSGAMVAKLDAAWHRNDTNQLVVLRGTKSFFFSYTTQKWDTPVELATAELWKKASAPFESNPKVDSARYDDSLQRLVVVVGRAGYLYSDTNKAWQDVRDLASPSAWNTPNGPFENGKIVKIDAQWHIDDTNTAWLVQGTKAYINHLAPAPGKPYWDPPQDLTTTGWAVNNAPFESNPATLDAAWHRADTHETYVVRDTTLYVFNNTAKTWKEPEDLAVSWNVANAPFEGGASQGQ